MTTYVSDWSQEVYPDFRNYALEVEKPAAERHESTRKLGELLRDTFARNARQRNFRLFCPDEINSNRLGAVFEVENRCFVGPTIPNDDHVSHDGRVFEVLSEHLCEGWLEGYLLSGRHGLFASYEAFAMIPASMVVQQTSPLIARRMRAASLAEMSKPESVRRPRTRRDDGLSRTPRGLRMALNLYPPL